MRKFVTSLVLLFGTWLSAAVAPTDDCEFIRVGIKKLASGEEFVIPAGEYTCASPLVLDRDHLTLRGEKNTTLKLAAGANAPVIVMGDIRTPPKVVFDVKVADLKIDGNRRNQKTECWGGLCDGTGTTAIRNNGISVRALEGGSIKNVSVISARSGGVVTELGTSHFLIDGLDASDSEFDGFAACETTASVFTHMDLHDNTAAGISTDIRFNDNVIRDSSLKRNHDVGIFMRDSSRNHYENVVIEDSGNHGVFAAWVFSPGTCPLDNDFHNLQVLRSKGHGFLLNNDCSGNKLTGAATFRKNRDACIQEAVSDIVARPDQMTCEKKF